MLRFGARTEAFTLLLEGRLDGYLHRDGREEHDHYHQAPTWLGAMSTLTGDDSIVTIRATQPSRIGRCPPRPSARCSSPRRSRSSG